MTIFLFFDITHSIFSDFFESENATQLLIFDWKFYFNASRSCAITKSN